MVNDRVAAALKRTTDLYEAELAAAGPLRTADDIPLSYEAVTDEWLTAILCHATPGAKVVGHQLGEVDNGTTNRRRIHVDYNSAGRATGLEQRLFCKASFSLESRFALGVTGAAAAEVNFYRYVRSHLTIEATEAVFANINDAYNSIVVSRDITDSVREFCDHETVIDRTRAESQMRLLATLHAQGSTTPAILASHGAFQSFSELFEATKSYGLDRGAAVGFLASADMIPARSYARHAEVWGKTEEAVKRASKRPQTLTHGDVHLKNWYIAGNGEMGLGDWQCTTIGHWGRDLAYALSTALTVENRRAWERDLIALYLDQLGQLGGQVAGFDEAWGYYREQMLPALAWWTVTLTPPAGAPEMQPKATAVEFVHRIGTAVDDLESLDA